MGAIGTGEIWRGGECSDANRNRRFPPALGDRLRASWPLGRGPRRGGENDEDQSPNHFASVAAAIFLPRPCNPRPLRPRSRAIGHAGEIAAVRRNVGIVLNLSLVVTRNPPHPDGNS